MNPKRESKSILLTPEMIHAGQSSAGGWNAKQIQILGLSWPPRNGWIKKLSGTLIAEESYAEFMAMRGITKKIEKQQKHHAPHGPNPLLKNQISDVKTALYYEDDLPRIMDLRPGKNAPDSEKHHWYWKIYLQSNYWRDKREELFGIHGRGCLVCRKTSRIHIHHFNYDHLGAEAYEDAIPLCESCHQKAHRLGKFKSHFTFNERMIILEDFIKRKIQDVQSYKISLGMRNERKPKRKF